VTKLVRAEGEVRVNEQVRSVGVTLREGDRVIAPEGGIAVIEYQDGCRDSWKGAKTMP